MLFAALKTTLDFIAIILLRSKTRKLVSKRCSDSTLAKQNKRKAPTAGQPNNTIVFDIPEQRSCRKSSCDMDSMDEEMCDQTIVANNINHCHSTDNNSFWCDTRVPQHTVCVPIESECPLKHFTPFKQAIVLWPTLHSPLIVVMI
ncbi:unnamed protein product [Medioppia subpectinata]|uniref:Uncharacterized protein n=1 Tax=Medioppia subpectinata TaxID=1979941 RepID=A0A7R9KFG8_9ACAR|nr:unnamed protein product [Medioppia subpectinata]CAG2102381.1 unnamed protein product [Medioppia subpectinata]